MTVFLKSEVFEGTPSEMFHLDNNAVLLSAWDKAIGQIEESERAAASEDGVICGHHSH